MRYGAGSCGVIPRKGRADSAPRTRTVITPAAERQQSAAVDVSLSDFESRLFNPSTVSERGRTLPYMATGAGASFFIRQQLSEADSLASRSSKA